LTEEEILREFLPKILGFSVMKLGHTPDAQDLSQEIALQLWRILRSGKEVQNPAALTWSIAQHTFCKFLRQKKYGTAEYLPESILSEENIEERMLAEEQAALLRRELAFLEQRYRTVMIRFYFDGRSCGEIAGELGIPVGTVKWWLHEARHSVKEGITAMRKYGERSYKPGRLTLSCQGSPGADNEPMRCVRSSLAQNILLAAYAQPRSVAELCEETGVPAAYLEDEIAYLTENQLLASLSGGQVQTDFVILPNGDTTPAHRIYEVCFPGFYRELMEVLGKHREELLSPALNTAGFSWERLLWVLLHVIAASVHMRFRSEVCGAVDGKNIPRRPNGGRWIALGFAEDGENPPSEYPFREYIGWDGTVQRFGKAAVQGYFHHWSGLSSQTFFDLPGEVFDLCAAMAKGEISPDTLDERQRYSFSLALEHRLYLRGEGGFLQNFCFVRREDCRTLQRIADEFYPRARPYLDKAWAMIRARYEKSVPIRLRWQMGNFLSNALGVFVTASMYEGVREGALSVPDENNRQWLSLFVTE